MESSVVTIFTSVWAFRRRQSGRYELSKRHIFVVSYSDGETIVPSCNWTVNRLVSVNNDYILDPLELFQLDVTLPTSGNVSLGAYETFSMEIKPPDGPTLVFERTMPGRESSYVNLH